MNSNTDNLKLNKYNSNKKVSFSNVVEIIEEIRYVKFVCIPFIKNEYIIKKSSHIIKLNDDSYNDTKYNNIFSNIKSKKSKKFNCIKYTTSL